MQFERIPHEMRLYGQWIVWRYEPDPTSSSGKPKKVPYDAKYRRHAAVNDPATFSSYEQAVATFASSNGWFNGIGFVFTEHDPFCFLDFDDIFRDQEYFKGAQAEINALNSYTEWSPSRTGVHVICKATTERGVKTKDLEIYSQGRYATMTGDALIQVPISLQQHKVDRLYSMIAGRRVNGSHVIDLATFNAPQQLADEEVINRAMMATNADKFAALYTATYSSEDYPSQSEADQAFVNMLVFYTNNLDQIERIWMNSPIGQREKTATRKDYRERTIRLAFDRHVSPEEMARLREVVNATMPVINVTGDRYKDWKPNYELIHNLPSGLLKEVAAHIMNSANRPVPEVALAGAIGFMSGLLGRAFNVSRMGLNQYIILLADTGVGKDQMRQALNRLLNEVAKTNDEKTQLPAEAPKFLGPAEFSSAPGLIKYLAKNQSFCSIMGEYGLSLQAAAMGNNANALALRRAYLDIYGVSGRDGVIKPWEYSDKDKSTEEIKSPAFTMLAESTGKRFFEAIDEDNVTEGLIPRFLTIEYDGPRVNYDSSFTKYEIPRSLVWKIREVVIQMLQYNQKNFVIDVQATPEAQKLLDAFSNRVDDLIREKKSLEPFIEVWNRAHLKALKLAALAAACRSGVGPTITREDAEWAIGLATQDAERLSTRFREGRYGRDVTDELRVITLCKRVAHDFAKKKENDALRQQNVFGYSALSRSLHSYAAFRKDKRGSQLSLKLTLQDMERQGLIKAVTALPNVGILNGLHYMVASPEFWELAKQKAHL